MKTCNQCKGSKPAAQFYRHPTAKDGRAGICKECHNRRMKLRRRTDPRVQASDRERSRVPKKRAQIALVAKRWRKKYPERYRAQNALNNALRDGKVVKGACARCGATEYVHAHHHDYEKPLDVEWLCALHHARLHSDA